MIRKDKARKASEGERRKIAYPSPNDLILTNQIITGKVPLEIQKGDSESLKKLKASIRQSGLPVGSQKIPKTDFIKAHRGHT